MVHYCDIGTCCIFLSHFPYFIPYIRRTNNVEKPYDPSVLGIIVLLATCVLRQLLRSAMYIRQLASCRRAETYSTALATRFRSIFAPCHPRSIHLPRSRCIYLDVSERKTVSMWLTAGISSTGWVTRRWVSEEHSASASIRRCMPSSVGIMSEYILGVAPLGFTPSPSPS